MSLPKLFHLLSKPLFLFLFSLCCVLTLGFVSPVNAQTPAASKSTVANDVVINSHTKSQIQLIEFSSALICQLIGIDIVNPSQPCLGVNSATGKIGYAAGSSGPMGGLMGLAIGGITTTYQAPASSTQFSHYLASNFGLLKPAVAADPKGAAGSFVGFAFLQELFITVRDLTFMLLVILFIIIGVAIMLRLKIDPRTVMSIQNQIPKIVIGIILISFSYAIAGILTDMMWVTTYFGINTIGGIAQQECTTGVSVDDPKTITEVASRSLLNSPLLYAHSIFNTNTCFGPENSKWSGLWGLSQQVAGSIGGILTSTVMQGLGGGLSDIAKNTDCSLVDYFKKATACLKSDVFQLANYIISQLAQIVIIIAILLALTRIWFGLIKAYAYIMLDIITAPIQIGMGLAPGNKMGFSKWIRHLLAYLLVFPATAAMIVFASVVALNTSINNPNGSLTFIPPFLGNPYIPNNLGALLAFGILMITPELLEMLKDALQVKNSDRATKAVQGGLGRGIAPVGAGMSGMGKEMFGHDKNGAPKIGNQAFGWVGQKIGVSGRGAEDRFLSKGPINWARRTRDNQIARRDKLARQTVQSRLHEATSIGSQVREQEYRKRINDGEGHGTALEQAIRLGEEAREKAFRNSNPSASQTRGAGTPRPSLIQRFKARGTGAPATSTAAATSPTGSPTPSGSHPTPPAPVSPAATPANTATANPAPTPGPSTQAQAPIYTIPVKWEGDILKQDTLTGTQILRKIANGLYIDLRDNSSQNIPDLNVWLASKGFTLV